MPKTDRRILRTRRHLGMALLSLIEEKGYDAVTIREITERADIAYATFFRHYESKTALLMEQMEKILQEIESRASHHQEDYFISEGKLLFEHFQSNQTLYRNMLKSMEVLESLKQMIIRNIAPHMLEVYNYYEKPELPFDLLVNHSVSSLLSLLRWWLENDMPHSIEEMAHFYQLLVIKSGWQMMDDANRKGHAGHVSPNIND